MNVLKKDGRIEKYNPEKVIRSIKNSANDCSLTFNESDLNLICKEIKNKLNVFACNDTRIISSIEIKYITHLVLTDFGFNSIANNYRDL